MRALSPEEAIAHVADGGLLGFPTETTWGLAADARSEAALAGLRGLKGRDAEKPVSVLLDAPDALALLGAEIGPAAEQLAAAFWPGPLTLVLQCAAGCATGVAGFASGVAGPDGAVGFRCSSHPVAQALAALARSRGVGPLTATSLNLSGGSDCATRAEAETLASGGVALAQGPDAGGAAPSTVVDATGRLPRILREGAISRTELARILSGELAA